VDITIRKMNTVPLLLTSMVLIYPVLLPYDLLTDSVSRSDFTASRSGIISGKLIGNDVEVVMAYF